MYKKLQMSKHIFKRLTLAQCIDVNVGLL